jgi:hypothetical protein
MRCEHCNGCITEGPDYHGDTAHYAILGESDIVCEACIRKDFAQEYLEGLEDNPRQAVHVRGVDPAKFGYVQVARDFENGFHPGQSDDPVKIAKDLKSRGYSGILFSIDSSGQFDIRFSAFAKGLPSMTAWQANVSLGEPIGA